MSTRMLSRERKDMQASLLVKSMVMPVSPAIVEYTETDYCLSFGGIIVEMINWGKMHRKKMKAS